MIVASRERCHVSKGFMMQAKGHRTYSARPCFPTTSLPSRDERAARVFSRDPGLVRPLQSPGSVGSVALEPATKSVIVGRGWGHTHGQVDRQRVSQIYHFLVV